MVEIAYSVRTEKNDKILPTSPHLSLPPPAKTRRGFTSFEPWNAANNLRLLVPCPDSSLCVSSALQGCHVDAIFSDMHILDTRPCPTVKSNDKNPNNISSATTQQLLD